MAHLPPVGWADVATKHDLAGLEQRLDLPCEAVEQRLLAAFRGEQVSRTRLFVFAMVASLATIASLAFAAARLT